MPVSEPSVVDDEIQFARRGDLMVVTLNRPRALNALTLPMCRALDEGLRAWQADPAIGAVLIKGEGDRAFCAGGDIRWLHGVLTAEGAAAACRFYALEYPMNARLHHFPKPWIALLDGIAMGGGVGVSVHGSHRIVTERTLFAMPETGIGLFPDVGATFMLPRLPGGLGLYLGLTGARLGAADCLHAGIGTAHVAADRLDALEASLARTPLRERSFRRGRRRARARSEATRARRRSPICASGWTRAFGRRACRRCSRRCGRRRRAGALLRPRSWRASRRPASP